MVCSRGAEIANISKYTIFSFLLNIKNVSYPYQRRLLLLLPESNFDRQMGISRSM